MMMPVTSISATITDPFSRFAPFDEQAQFERALAQAAASTKNDIASAPARAAPVPAPMDVQRAPAQTSPVGDRVIQTISSMYRDNTATSAARDHEVALTKGALSGPAQSLPVEGGAAGTRMPGPLQGPHDFETMVAGLRNVYSEVTQVALVSKGVSGLTSSVNNLIKQG
ncbi:nodulation protein NolB [Mesorhizobium waimense]|uniref:Nodulation protein NolB n=1 Tax=Mesorhizobium waimense TaxID=1300307 RepID=A0A3A5K3S3_9HYPH|nr:nodulation protein NolB [Mesorhizobium waimense]RJT30039.1 nodulation protein NolB [Mesorhizobium waimense]